MAESNAAWGELAQHDDEMPEVWDGFGQLPDPGSNPALDAFIERKRLSTGALVRLGTRLAGPTVIAFGGPGYIKYRDVVTDGRWNYVGSTFPEMKVVPAGTEPAETCIIAEGETDAARLIAAYDCDVAVMPAGAGYFPQAYADQLSGYRLVLVGLDDDAAGQRGAKAILEALPNSALFAPPANDWCATEELPPLPDPAERVEAKVLVPAGELLALDPPQLVSWFEHSLLPVAGSLILHGWAKSYKSFLALDMLAALAEGRDWCCFEPSEEPCRVAVMQYEIPWAYYQHRVRVLRDNATRQDLFDANFLTFTPLQRPSFVAGNKAQEDYVLRALETADVQVFCLDPVRRATGVADLSSEKEVRPLLAFFQRCNEAGITVITCHHDNKSYARQGGGDPLGMTGSGAFSGDFDTIVSVSLPKGKHIDDPQRNMHFLLRNAASLGPRGMEMGSDGHITYNPEPYGDGLAGDDSGPAI